MKIIPAFNNGAPFFDVNSIYNNFNKKEPHIWICENWQQLRLIAECFQLMVSSHANLFVEKSVYVRKEFDSRRIGLGDQHAGQFIIVEQQCGCRDFKTLIKCLFSVLLLPIRQTGFPIVYVHFRFVSVAHFLPANLLKGRPLTYFFGHFVNCNARTTCTNSSWTRPHFGWDQDQQCKISYKTNWNPDRTAKKGKFDRTNLLQGLHRRKLMRYGDYCYLVFRNNLLVFMSLCNPSKFCISLEQARKVLLLTFSTQTVAASCFRPTTVCWAVTKMCGEVIPFDWNEKQDVLFAQHIPKISVNWMLP